MSSLFLSGEIPNSQRLNDRVNVSRTVYQKATQSTNNNSNVPSTDLILSVAANSLYVLEVTAFYDTDSVADFFLQFTGPVGFTFPILTWWGQALTDSAINSPIGRRAFINDSGFNNFGGVAAGTVMSVRPNGLFQTGATPGDLGVQFSQFTSTPAVTTKLVAGSWMRLTKVA